MNRKLLLPLALAAGLIALFFLSFTVADNLLNAQTAHGEGDVVAPCPVGDADCNGRINIVDLQSIATLAGTPQESETYQPDFDFDENGLIDLDDIYILRPSWQLPTPPAPVTGTAGLDGGPPRLGYAVDGAGRVFLRWQLPISPYSATVEVLRQPAPPTALPTGRPNVGIVAQVDPIYDDATAMPLLGDHWSYLSGVFSSTINADGVRVPVTLTSVAEMHQYIQEGTNSFVVQAIANQDAGVAQVLGKGYWDADFTATGVYTYWVRVNGRIVGPVRVDTSNRTELIAPENVTAFEGTVNVPGSGHNDLTLQNMKRGAHASIFLRWNPDLNRRPNHPQWQNGFNVWRQSCLAPNNCGEWTKVNQQPVFPKVTAAETLETEAITNSLGISVITDNEIHDFHWFWADSDLRTDRLYCYRVTALDLLQQDGAPSATPADNSHCLRPPDYLPPQTVDVLNVEVREATQNSGAQVRVTIPMLPEDERNGDAWLYILYRARHATEPWPSGWEQVYQVSPDVPYATLTLIDGQVKEHEEFWYRVVVEDSNGNRSIPGAPVIARVDDNTPPAKPGICIGLPGQPLTKPCFSTPADTAFMRIYRRYTTNGVPLLVDRVPVGDWATWTDDYTPLRATQVFYQAIAEDEAGNLSEISSPLAWTLSPNVIQSISSPVISDTQIISAAGSEYHGVVTWQMVGAQNLVSFTIYRDDGPDRPTDTSTMMEVGTLTVQGRGVAGNVTNVYTFTDTSSGIDADELVWYIVEADPLIGASKISNAYPARYVNLDDLGERPMESFVVRRAQWNANKNQVEIELPDRATCCYILFRSRDGVNDFTQITPIVAGSSFVDGDVRPGDTAYYQILEIDGGTVDFVNKSIDPSTAGGEIVAYTPVFRVTLPNGLPTPPVNPAAPRPQQPLPGGTPANLQFGPNWKVQVRNYSSGTVLGGGTARVSGDGAVQLAVSPTRTVEVSVTFSSVIIDITGTVQSIDPGGSAEVHVNNLPVLYPDRWRYLLETMHLTEAGAFADVILYNVDADLKHWLITPNGPGSPLPLPGADVPIDGPDLTFSRTVPGTQDCAADPTTLFFPFAVTDWPLLIVPTASFTVTEQGVDFTATCTLYRDRFVNEDVLGNPLVGVLEQRNDAFLRESYTSGPVSYRINGGLNGTWTRNAAHTYRTAFPFRFEMTANAWSFNFVNGRMSGGAADSGSLFFRYRGGNGGLRDFTGTFTDLTLNANAAITGTLSTTDTLRWTQFGLNPAGYALYVPPAVSPRVPRLGWTVAAGKPATAIPGDQTHEPGLNAQSHDLKWVVCPASTPGEIVFPAGSGALDLYVRRGGVSGVADYLLSPPTDMSLAGYQTDLARFGLSWMDNVELDSAVAGSIFLPYPANVTLRFDSLTLVNGCVESGQLLPDEQQLDYWNTTITPWLAKLEETSSGSNVYKLWLWADADVKHLTRIDGVGAAVQLDLPFNPNGAFCDTCTGEVVPQDAVYAVDDFYVTLKDLRFSNYPSESPAWDGQITIETPPTLSEGFVELTAGIYLPMFGEVTDPNSARILVAGDQEYVGFVDQPLADQPLSDSLDVQLTFNLVYAQAMGNTASRWIGAGVDRTLDVAGETIAEIPHALVMEPDRGDLVVGFPAVSALFLAADEAYATWPGRSRATAGEAAARFDGWRDELGINIPVLDFESDLGAFFVGEGMTNYETLISDINAEVTANHSGEVDQWITSGDLELVHYQFPLLRDVMSNSPAQIKWVRGSAVLVAVRDQDNRIIDGTLDRLEAGTMLKVYTNPRAAGAADDGNQSPLLQAPLTMVFDAQGWISLEAIGIQGGLLEEQLKLGSLDVSMRLLFSSSLGYGVEGGLTLHDLETDLAVISKAGAVAGFTLDKTTADVKLLYVGAFLDITLDVEVIGRINVGGSMLFGRLDSDSPVLQAEYGDLFDDMSASGIIEGAYVMVYANNIPIFQVGEGCLGIEIKGGGEVAFWVFTQDGVADTAWGVRLGVNAMGEAFCIASAKADITLTLDNDFGQDNLDLTGNAWAGAGCGDCEPENWKEKADVYDDKWCLKCVIDLHFVIPLANSNTKSDFTFDADCPF